MAATFSSKYGSRSVSSEALRDDVPGDSSVISSKTRMLVVLIFWRRRLAASASLGSAEKVSQSLPASNRSASVGAKRWFSILASIVRGMVNDRVPNPLSIASLTFSVSGSSTMAIVSVNVPRTPNCSRYRRYWKPITGRTFRMFDSGPNGLSA